MLLLIYIFGFLHRQLKSISIENGPINVVTLFWLMTACY